MFVLFVALVAVMHHLLRRTGWAGQCTRWAATWRRGGINVNRVYMSVFALCSGPAALGGVLAAARLAAANQSSGGGDVNLNAIATAVIGARASSAGAATPSRHCSGFW